MPPGNGNGTHLTTSKKMGPQSYNHRVWILPTGMNKEIGAFKMECTSANTLISPQCQTSELQNCETRNFCCLSHEM